MGGPGSGRRWHSNTKDTTESSRPLDIRKLQRAGVLVPSRWFGWEWTLAGRSIANIQILVEEGRVVLVYRYRCSGENDWQNVEQPINLEFTACNLGGTRPWWLCPSCGRRVAVLYGPGKYYACRHCYGLVYDCQRESADDRAARRADRIRKRLGWVPGILNGSGWKPKGMRWSTYKRLTAEHDAFVQVSLAGMARRFGILKDLQE